MQILHCIDRYLANRRHSSDRSLAFAQDDGLAGHADADSGPEGPPQHVGPGVGAPEA